MEINRKRLHTQAMAQIGLMTAILAIFAPMSLPIGPVPISITNFILFLMLYILGTKKTLMSYSIYLLLGIAGLPVFSGFSGGIFKFVGPTGGYLIGFYFLIILAGFVIDRKSNVKIYTIVAMGVGMFFCYLLGTVWLALSLNLSFWDALYAGVIPFFLADVVKIFLAALVGPQLKKRISVLER